MKEDEHLPAFGRFRAWFVPNFFTTSFLIS